MDFIKKLKISQKIFYFVVSVSFFMLVIGGIGYYFINQSTVNMDNLYQNRVLPIGWLGKMNMATLDNKANLLGIILAAQDNDRKTLNVNADDITNNASIFVETLKKYESMNLNTEETAILKSYKESLVSIKAKRQEIIRLSKQGKTKEAYAVYKEILAPYEVFVSSGQKLSDITTAAAEKINQTNDAAAKFAIILTLSISITIIIVALMIGIYIARMVERRLGNLVKLANMVASGDFTANFRIEATDEIGITGTAVNNIASNLRELVKEIYKSAENLAAGSEELSASSEQTAQGAQQVAISVQQLAAGAQQVSHNVEEGATNLGHINKTIQGISKESKAVSELGNSTETNANEGKSHVKKAVDKIYNIKTVSANTSVTIDELGQLSSEIEQIVDMIKGIAGQTNLLALNAAIEAARAGEHGKGFAVVAEEVKKLAGESADATDKITSMIKEIQSKTKLAVSSMDKGVNEVEEGVIIINNAGKALEVIIEDVEKTNTKIQGITKEIDKVASDTESVLSMIENISAVTEETSASAEEISSITEEQTASTEEIGASSHSLAQIAENLHKQVSVFKI